MRRVGRRGLALGAAVGIAIGCLPRAGAGAEGDPSIGFVRFLGGQVEDTVRDVAIDADGNVIAVGGTGSPDFPTTPGAFDRSLDPGSDGASFGAHDVWVAKLAPDGRLLWSTLIGGPG